MNESYSASYAAAGVDITAGYKAVELMKAHVARTMTAGMAENIGGFGGLYELDTAGMKHPCLVSGTDGVGTKIRLAQLMDKHDTIGIDCVAMCVNKTLDRKRFSRNAEVLTMSSAAARSHCFSWITSPAARTVRKKSRPSLRA